MQEAAEQYRGYQIVVVPIKDREDFWDFEYRLSRGADPERVEGVSVDFVQVGDRLLGWACRPMSP